MKIESVNVYRNLFSQNVNSISKIFPVMSDYLVARRTVLIHGSRHGNYVLSKGITFCLFSENRNTHVYIKNFNNCFISADHFFGVRKTDTCN